ncbi:uncharacterized protein DS421_13g404530 [Arachis hypogaea]|nr:uncharacterized protein DS421_13g404530 [Arachis hypogaea]
MRRQWWLLPCARSAPPLHGSGSRSSSSDGDTMARTHLRRQRPQPRRRAAEQLTSSGASSPFYRRSSFSLCFLGFHSLFPAFPVSISLLFFFLFILKLCFFKEKGGMAVVVRGLGIRVELEFDLG